MKNIKYFFGMLFLSLLLIMQITSCGSGGEDAAPAPTPETPFITSDLNGTWYLYATNGVGASPAENIVAGNLRGKLILDSLGQVVSGGSFFRSNNASTFLSAGIIAMDSSGVLSGSVTTGQNSGVSFYVDSGKMDSSKNILSFVAHTNFGEDDLITAIRQYGGFSSVDLAATWHVFSAGGDYGQITVSNGSDNIKATIAAPGGGGFFSIDGNGLLNDAPYSGTSYVATQSVTNPNLYLKQGKITYTAKDIMFFVAGNDSSNFDLATAIRGGGIFTSADLSGTWFINGASSKGTDKATLSGTITLDSLGKVTGSYTRSDTGGKVSFTGGTVTIDAAGVLSGSAVTDNDGTISFASGKMNAAKGMMSLTGSTGSGDKDFFFCIKGN